jgi:division protein CdvB (Snf7/Vps24/ESCRT-III family)
MQKQEEFTLDMDKASATLQTELLRLLPIQTKIANVEKEMREQIVIDVFRGEKMHADMLANELVVIRRVSRLVSDLRIIYETLIIRIGTVDDYKQLLKAVNPAATSLKEIRKDLDVIVPAANATFTKMSDMFSSTLAMLNLVNEPSAHTATDDALAILEEANSVVGEELKRKFPTLPQITVEDRVTVEA